MKVGTLFEGIQTWSRKKTISYVERETEHVSIKDAKNLTDGFNSYEHVEFKTVLR